MTAAVHEKPSLREWTADHFAPHLSGIFRFEPAAGANGEPIELKLIEVTRHRRQRQEANGAGREPFSLLFLRIRPGEMAPVLHTLVHDAFARDLIFVSRIVPPAGMDPKEAYYEAVFN